MGLYRGRFIDETRYYIPVTAYLLYTCNLKANSLDILDMLTSATCPFYSPSANINVFQNSLSRVQNFMTVIRDSSSGPLVLSFTAFEFKFVSS